MSKSANINDILLYASNIIAPKINDINTIYNTKQKKITGAATSILSNTLTQNRVIISDNLGKISTSIVTPTELSYLNNLTNPIISNINNLTEYIKISSNILKTSLSTTSNNIDGQINQINTERTAYILNTSNNISTRLNNLNLDNISNGITKRFIVNNIYDRDLTINGTLDVNELLVLGDLFNINTTTYQTSNLNITTLTNTNDIGLKISSGNTSGSIFKLNGTGANNTMTILANGNVGIRNTNPLYALDVNGIINISQNKIFMINNRQLAYSDLTNIPSTFTPSLHPLLHNISNITGLETAINNKQDYLGLEWNLGENRIDVNKNINLINGYRFKINGIIASSGIASLNEESWALSIDNSLSKNNVKISSNSILINSTLTNNSGIYLNDGDLITYSGNIITDKGNISSKNSIINNNININNKWRIYANNDTLYDLNFENSTDNGSTWNLKAKMNGFGNYLNTVYTNFTGIHHCKANKNDLYNDKYIGYIVSTTKKYCGINSIYGFENLQRNFDKEAWDFLPVVELSTKAYDKSHFGIITKIENNNIDDRFEISGIISYPIEKKEHDRRLHIAGCGEGGIWICNYNGLLEAGDFITTSFIPGIGMKQDDDLVYNYTVGKITMDCDFNPKILDNDEYEYEIKYIELNGNIINVDKYNELLLNNSNVYKMAFVGCSYKSS